MLRTIVNDVTAVCIVLVFAVFITAVSIVVVPVTLLIWISERLWPALHASSQRVDPASE